MTTGSLLGRAAPRYALNVCLGLVHGIELGTAILVVIRGLHKRLR